MSIYDQTICSLGEGPLWHPGLNQLFWFDILGGRLYTRKGDTLKTWQFTEDVSAAGWVDDSTLIIASETALFRFDLATGARSVLVHLEADNPLNRSNDGRADPQGGFWIGTMAKDEAPGAGAIYRYYRGELRRLYANIGCPNAICFTPDGRFAHYTDSGTCKVMKQALDAAGWPLGAPVVWLDMAADGTFPDGAVIDASGVMWLARWGAYRVTAYDPQGVALRDVAFAAAQTSCPAFGGPDGKTLYCTSATTRLSPAQLAAEPDNGKTFAVPGIALGQCEHRVIL